MTPEKLALYEKCYRNWNGTSVMESAFKELLSEVARLQAVLQKHCPHYGRTHTVDGWHCPNCEKPGPHNQPTESCM